jgi:tetratricopeptide (TPR) repeat protein
VNDPSATEWVLELHGLYSIGACQWSQADESLSRALDIAEQIGDLRKRDETSGLIGLAQSSRGQFSQAYDRFGTVYDSAVARGDHYLQLTNILNKAFCLLRLGHEGYLDEAQQCVETALALTNTNAGVEMEIQAYGAAAVVHLRRGERKQARQFAEHGLALAQKARPALCYAVEGYASLAEVYVELYRLESDAGSRRVLQHQAEAACATLSRYARVFLHAAARAALWQGLLQTHVLDKPGEARKAFFQALAAARRYAMPYDEALALAALGQHRRDAEQVRRAAVMFATLNARYDAARTTLENDVMVKNVKRPLPG